MEGLVPRSDMEDEEDEVANMSAADSRDSMDRAAVAFFCRRCRLHGRPVPMAWYCVLAEPELPSVREVVAVATDRPSQVAMVTTVPQSSSSPSKLEG